MTRQIYAGPVAIGGGAPVSIQSMLNTRTTDVEGSLRQIRQLAAAGCEIARLAIPDMDAAHAFREICAESPLPLVADIHFDYRLAIAAAMSLLCGAYDGLYGPGAGTFMLLSYTILARMGVREASGQMKAVNLSSNLAAFATFALSGEVIWALGLIAGCFSIAGHYIGAGLVLKNGTKIVRPIIAVVLSILFVKTAWELLA